MSATPWGFLSRATMSFCEQNLNSWISEPANTWSNISYIAVGVFILVFLAKKYGRGFSDILPVIAIYTGLTSGVYHASDSFLFQVFDLSSMYLFSSFLLSYTLKQLTGFRSHAFYIVFVLSFAVSLIVLLVVRKQIGDYLFGVQIAFVIGAEVGIDLSRVKKARYWSFYTALAIFGVAWIVWILDYTKVWCNPQNHIIQGHALWHVLNSLCFVFAFIFYKQFEPVGT
jgi:hypothetical protein